MILCDAGPLIALVDQAESENHRRCMAVLPSLHGPLISTWPCFTEAMYFLAERGGLPFQQMLWRFFEAEKLDFFVPSKSETIRMQSLMTKYGDIPMDLADASLVVAAESLNVTQIFTLDTHFHAYRINDRHPFEV